MSDCRFGVSSVNYPDPEQRLKDILNLLQDLIHEQGLPNKNKQTDQINFIT